VEHVCDLLNADLSLLVGNIKKQEGKNIAVYGDAQFF